MENEGIRQTGHPNKTWWDCVRGNLESFGLSHKDDQERIDGDQESRRNWLTQIYILTLLKLLKLPLNIVCASTYLSCLVFSLPRTNSFDFHLTSLVFQKYLRLGHVSERKSLKAAAADFYCPVA